MKIIHTADLHFGQVLYDNYDRGDEHRHFFKQLKQWCNDEQPDALLLSGDVFDIQQPSAATKKAFNDYFADLHKDCPEMHIVITAGNHDSASRLQADSVLWQFANTTLVGVSPAMEAPEGWQEHYIVRLKPGYIIAMPYMLGERKAQLQNILDKVAAENIEGKPVVMMGHSAVAGLDATGHRFDTKNENLDGTAYIGKLKTQEVASFGQGFDYLALGHIHKPQTIGHQEDALKQEVEYPAPVIRYSGSALHVSCDEKYPHSVSLVDIDRHGGTVRIRQLTIDELRHFYELPMEGSAFLSREDALNGIKKFVAEYGSGYIRLHVDNKAVLPANFIQEVYDTLATSADEVRYNPSIIWEGQNDRLEATEKPVFEVAELQQMTDPMAFIEKTINQYPNLDLDELREAFREVEEEVQRLSEAGAAKKAKGRKKKANEETDEEGEAV
ncbi:MAG: exonuclease SbcCD subunit D [Bacteroidales bacterium]|nr:exonuclease SbcCD subunit D [Bacteroidales bacterium]